MHMSEWVWEARMESIFLSSYQTPMEMAQNVPTAQLHALGTLPIVIMSKGV